MNSSASQSRAGFTLMEILVALVLIGLLVGTLLPTVLGQVGRGEANRLHEDLDGVNTAAKSFRTDVQRWPSDLEDLVVQPTTGDTALTGSAYPAALQARWAGPYLELGAVGTGIASGMGGTILNDVGKTLWNGKNFLTVKVLNIALADAQTLSTRVDGDSVTAPASESAGKVRWKAGTSGVDTLLYLASPIQ